MKKKPEKFKIGDHEFAVGDEVTAVVEWQNGRRTNMEGTLITVHDGKAYLQTYLGPVEADAHTVEPA